MSHLKRLLPLAIILAAGIAAIVAAEWQHIAARPSPQAVLTAAADAQHELTRVPAHFDVMSDADEIALGTSSPPTTSPSSRAPTPRPRNSPPTNPLKPTSCASA